MKVLIDTNILLDFLARRPDYFEFANRIINACKSKKIDGFIAAHAVTDVFYILRKEYGVEARRIMLKHLLNIVNVVKLDKERILSALSSDDILDLEDSIQACSAEYCNVDYIITRDLVGFPNVSMSVISSEEFCKLLDDNE